MNRSPLSPRGQNWIIFSLTDCNDTNPLCSIRLAENSVLCYTMGVIFFKFYFLYTCVTSGFLRGPQKLEEISMLLIYTLLKVRWFRKDFGNTRIPKDTKKSFRNHLTFNVKTKMEILSNFWPSQNILTLRDQMLVQMFQKYLVTLQVILFEIDCAIFYTNLQELFFQFISWTNFVNSGKFMNNWWISCQVMADMKKIYDDLIIINLYVL